MSTGENLLHVLNTLESRSVVLEAELREIDDDILLNATMQRKYGAESFTEGAAKLTQTRVRAAAFVCKQLRERLTAVGVMVKLDQPLIDRSARPRVRRCIGHLLFAQWRRPVALLHRGRLRQLHAGGCPK